MKSVCKMCGDSYIDKLNLSPWCKKCNEEMDSWDVQQNQSKKENSTNVKNKSDFGTKIPNGEQKSQQEEKRITPQMLKSTESSAEKNIKPQRKKQMQDESNGHKKIENDNSPTKEVTIYETPNDSESLSMQVVEKEIQSYEESTLSYSDLKKELSRSINLLNQSENELFSSMKGLRSSQPETTVKLYDPERVQTAVLCGRSIVESMKTKLELLKFAKELK